MNDMILALIEQAVRAPSSHNTQPWLFRVREGAVEVHADYSRALPVNDPHNRELQISCGAALFNLEVAAARAGVGTETTPLPDASNPSHLATVSLGGEPAPIVAKVSHEAVRLAQGPPSTAWLKIGSADRATGYVSERYLRSPIDYRASFVRDENRWVLQFFAAGD